MELHRNDNQTEHMLTASGTIGVADLPALRTMPTPLLTRPHRSRT
jgi:hypothetical protein